MARAPAIPAETFLKCTYFALTSTPFIVSLAKKCIESDVADWRPTHKESVAKFGSWDDMASARLIPTDRPATLLTRAIPLGCLEYQTLTPLISALFSKIVVSCEITETLRESLGIRGLAETEREIELELSRVAVYLYISESIVRSNMGSYKSPE